MKLQHRALLLGAVAVFATVTAACSSGAKASTSQSAGGSRSAAGPLVGLFKIDAGQCATGAITSGSYFRMVKSGGSVSAGPFVPNADSLCGDKTYDAVSAGSDGGLITGRFQPQPNPPFDASHAATANAIIQPAKFFGSVFGLSTNPKDPQTGVSLSAPSITADSSGALSGSLQAVNVAWNGQQFNQGSPKPDGSRPGNTQGPTGTYNRSTGEFVLQWSSQVVGGPFNGFTGLWYLTGTFVKQ
jgi:hypothetical protein